MYKLGNLEKNLKKFKKPLGHFVLLPDDVDAGALAGMSDAELEKILRRSKNVEDSFSFKVNPEMIVRQIGDHWMLVPTGKYAQRFNGVISLNVFSYFVWKQFEQPNSLGSVLRAAHDQFEDPHHMLDIQVRNLVQDYVRMGLFMRIIN